MIELQGDFVDVIGDCPSSEYPIQNKTTSFEFLRSVPHLRTRTSTISTVLRVRSQLSQLFHEVLGKWGFLHIHTPILTTNDCEGAGEVFSLSTQPSFCKSKSPNTSNPAEIEKVHAKANSIFNANLHLTVSGQLHAEAIVCGGHPRVYTFGSWFCSKVLFIISPSI